MLNRFRLNDQELTALIEKYLEGKASEQERERLLLWYRHEADQPASWPVTSAHAKQEVKYRMLQNIMEQIGTPKKQRKPYWKTVAAAVLVLIAGAGVIKLLQQKPKEEQIELVATRAGQRKIVTLPDGTKVWLGPRSELRYGSSFGTGNRNVVLEGEGFFEVAQQEKLPFIVNTATLSTRVLGTAFNIQAYSTAADVKVTLLSGAVMLSRDTVSSQLQPDQQAVYDKKTGAISRYNYPAAASMLKRREGNIEYKSVTVNEIVNDLENIYGIRVDVRGRTGKCLFFGRLRADETPEDFLGKLCIVSDIKLDKKDGVYVLSKGACN